MVNISGILSQAKTLYDDIHTQLINSSEVGVNVTLYYPPTYVDCSNCQLSSYGIIYKTGGPAPFTLGSCPLCASATCKKEVENSEVIKLRVYSVDPTSFSRSNFKKMGISVERPEGELLSIGFMSDLLKVRSANYAVFYSDNQPSTGSMRYKLAGDPRPHGIGKDTFFFCFWEKA